MNLKILKQYDNIVFDFQTIKIKISNSSKIDDLNSKVYRFRRMWKNIERRL